MPVKARRRKPVGLGDTVEQVLEVTRIADIYKKITREEDCSPCQKRREKLNSLVPYKQQ